MRGRAPRPVLAAVVAAACLAAAPSAGAADREACFSAAESAQKVRAQGHLVDARQRLRICAAAGCPASVRGDCTTWLNEVDQELPSIVVQARDAAGNDVADVRVLVDGARVADRLDGLPMEIDPGSHVVRLEREGAPPAERTVMVVAGQKAQVVTVPLAGGESPPPAPPEAGASSSFWRTAPTSVLVLGAVGAAALVGTAVLWTWGRVDYGSLEGSCSPGCSPSSVDAVRTKLVTGDALLGVGVAALGVATWLELTHAKAAQGPATAAELVVAPSRGGGLLGVGGRF